jgi:hypothetical protein
MSEGIPILCPERIHEIRKEVRNGYKMKNQIKNNNYQWKSEIKNTQHNQVPHSKMNIHRKCRKHWKKKYFRNPIFSLSFLLTYCK